MRISLGFLTERILMTVTVFGYFGYPKTPYVRHRHLYAVGQNEDKELKEYNNLKKTEDFRYMVLKTC